MNKFALSAAGVCALSAASVVCADIIVASNDLVIRREDGTTTPNPRIEARTGVNIHAKASNTNSTDRALLIRFDSGDFGGDVNSATFLLRANSDTGTQFQGTFDYRVWGVNDGDPQDEVFDEATYTGTANDIYDGSANLLDTTQLTNLGDVIGVTAGSNFNFSSADLLTFIQGDTNGTVTLVVERLTIGGNSTFHSSENAVEPPRLEITLVPEPSSLALLGLGGLLIARRRRG